MAAKVGIPLTQIRSRSPVDKRHYIQTLLSSFLSAKRKVKKPVVLSCGDGTNNAVALTSATVGVQMSTGTDVAESAADVVVMRPDLSCSHTYGCQ